MSIYKVTYRSLTATYGPSFIEAEDERQAKKKFAGTAFTTGELGCITARKVSVSEMLRSLNGGGDED